MNNKLKKLFTNCPSYLKKGAEFICAKVNCTHNELVRFRATPWYKEMRRNYTGK